jgi:hypothetical protein
VRDQALRVHGVRRHDERGQPERADRCPLLVGARKHHGLNRHVRAEPLEHAREERISVPVVERDLRGRPHDYEHARPVEPCDRLRCGLEVGEVVLLLQSLVAAQLRRPRSEAGQPLGRDRVGHDDPGRGAAAELVLQPRVLVVERGRARDPEAPCSQRELVGAVCERHVEVALAREPMEGVEAAEERPRLAEPACTAVPRPDDVVRNAVQLQQLERLGVLARRHLDLVSPRSEQLDQRPEERHVR